MTEQMAEKLAAMTGPQLAEAHAEAIVLGNAAQTVTYFPMAELARDITAELDSRGLRDCGVCRTSKPGAVDWGCTCSMTREERNAAAAEFARIHD